MVNIVRRGEGGEGRELAARRSLWDPFRMMRDLMRFDPFAEMEGLTLTPAGAFNPAVELRETSDGYVFKVELPGVSEKDMEISVTGNRLTISGERREEQRNENDRFFVFETSYGSFSRSFTLPEGIDPDNVRAEMKNGVLSVTVPKRPEVKPRRVSISGQSGAGSSGQQSGGQGQQSGQGQLGQSQPQGQPRKT
jgi:HSP20 family protein